MKRVIALGFFDGVHIGHQALLNCAKQRAAEMGATPSVISFDCHPDTLVRGVSVPLINTLNGRTELIRNISGIEDAVLLHFDRRLMQMPWDEFLQSLIGELEAVGLVIGYDFSCGWKGQGNAERISAWCSERNISCDVIAPVLVDGTRVSSTLIRERIEAGDMEGANRFLGHPHTLIDTVGYGLKIGRKIGTPTINMAIPEGVVVPAHGVYATRVLLPDGCRNAITNVGCNPTFGDGDCLTVESYILDFTGDLYGIKVQLEFFKYLRPEQKFPNPEKLRVQIQQDIEQTKDYFFRNHKAIISDS